MGKSSSSSSSSSQTTQIDERVATGDDSVVLQIEEGGSFQVIDPGSYEIVETSIKEVLGAFDRTLSMVEETQAQTNEMMQYMLQKNKTEASQGVELLIKAVAVVAVATIAGIALPKVWN